MGTVIHLVFIPLSPFFFFFFVIFLFLTPFLSIQKKMSTSSKRPFFIRTSFTLGRYKCHFDHSARNSQITDVNGQSKASDGGDLSRNQTRASSGSAVNRVMPRLSPIV